MVIMETLQEVVYVEVLTNNVVEIITTTYAKPTKLVVETQTASILVALPGLLVVVQLVALILRLAQPASAYQSLIVLPERLVLALQDLHVVALLNLVFKATNLEFAVKKDT